MNALLKPNGPKQHRPRAADLLQEFITTFPHAKVTLADFMTALGARAFGVAMLVFALANLLIANIPGISTILGIPIILISAQVMLGRERPWLPKFLTEKEFKKSAFEKMIRRTVPVLRKVEVFIRPRFLALAQASRFLGLVCFILGIVLALPIVFGNWLPSWALVFISIGMIERDGIVTLLGLVIGVAATCYAVAFYTGFVHLVKWLAV